ncbi:class I SAM-dependent methyltransferase [bacterium]|nr:class I SAM-dependent methyltransferase [bacterium]
MVFETIPCPICGGDDHRPERIVNDRFHVLGSQSYPLVRCAGCKLIFLNPRPDENSIGAFYETDGYDPFGSTGEHESLTTKLYKKARPLSIRRKAARVVESIKPGDRVLDCGCATGEFLIELKRRGFEAEGCEPSEKAADFARKQGLNVWTGDIRAVPRENGSYRLVTMWHVLEHVHRLRETLDRVRDLLGPKGQIAIAVPNPVSSDAKAYGDKWVAWDAPRHLYHFEPQVMLDLLIRAGFDPRRAGAVAFDAFYHSLMSETNVPMALTRGAVCGTISYLRGLAGGYGSSELYIGTKVSS